MKTPNDQEIRKFLQEKHDPQSQLEKLKSYSNAANSPLFNTDYHETYDVNILPDPKISPAKFIPDPLRPNVFRAHPVTIRAMRKELFMGGVDFVDLECLRICGSCKHEIDLQFWQFCPYCEASIN
ncbi:MAG: hypothetical protein PHY93_03065 [Bacteriovorax sp.]|nr:hypothetical protein [Bacteriovorax sp.]